MYEVMIINVLHLYNQTTSDTLGYNE